MGWFTCYGAAAGKEEAKKSKEGKKESSSTSRKEVRVKEHSPALPPPPPPPPPPPASATTTAVKAETINATSEGLQGPSEPVQKSEIPHGLNTHAHTFTFHELAVAAQNFSEDCLIGEGGFGAVFRGYLDDGQVVAIKKLNRHGLQGNREFLVEVLMLSLLQHKNLVNLIGYCADGDQRLLVYEYMPLGSLEDHLHDLPEDQEPLDWNTRIRIAAGAAEGLRYLHDTADPPVIYRDLKSSNILLGNDFHPKLSDFGLAKLGPVGDKSHVSTRVMGTYGYCAPEYAMTGQLTMKSDVYSFGVVLLELISGRKAMDEMRPSGQHNLVAWARPLFKDKKKFSLMADPNLLGKYPARGLCQALAVAAMCVHEQAASRPLIADVVTALTFLLQTPNNMVSSSPRSSAAATEPQHSASSMSADGAPSYTRIDGDVVYDEQCATSRGTDGSQSNGGDNDGSCLQSRERRGDADADADADAGAADDGDDKALGGTGNEAKYKSWRSPVTGKERAQAVAEARMWGEMWREKRGMPHLEKENTKP